MIEQICLSDSLLEAAKEIFDTMIFMSIQKTDQQLANAGDAVLGSITFQGDMEGCLAVTCPMPCAKAIAANMLAMEPDEQLSEAEISDAVGEVTNMVMGSLKSRLQETVGEINVSIPTVVKGKEIESDLSDGAEKINVPVSVEEQHNARFSLLYRQSQNNS